MVKSESVTGIILAGGKSTRMGFDKGLAIYHDKRLIDSVFEVLSALVDNVIIIANSNIYDYLDVPVYPDCIADVGPLGGIYTGLHHSVSEHNIIVACDMPLLKRKTIKDLLSIKDQSQIVIPSHKNGLEPLCGYYNKSIQAALKTYIDEEQLSLHKVISQFEHKKLMVPENEADCFTNVNRVSDLK